MKIVLVGSYLFLLYINVVTTEGSNSTIKNAINSKEVEKLSYPKKVSSIKKNIIKTSLKKIADVTDKFRDLPADDLAFIKELDKQFKLYGGKVQIKVENKNASESSKTNKRTIDGELGYGYAHNGYHYDPPKFMFYPYSQKDIDSNVHNYYVTGDGKTQVSVQPSYSYELKSQTYLTHNEPQIDVPKPEFQPHIQQQHFAQHEQYEEPVIVLRIPGPAKYATHLQMLLQKYLEIRAAQYLHILEETEQRNSQQQHQHQLQQLDYGHGNNKIAAGPIEQVEQHQQHETPDYTQQQIQYDQQNAVNTVSDQYPEIDNVYHSYKNRHPSHPEQAQQPIENSQSYYAMQQSEEQYTPQYEPQQHQHQPQQQQVQEQHHYQPEQLQFQQEVQEQPQFYYTHQQQYAQPEGPPENIYQQIYLVAMIPHRQADYEASQSQPEKQQNILGQDQEHSSPLPLAENNPRPSHTKVVFTSKNKHSPHDFQMYQLPSIKPNERHAPKSTPDYHQDFQQQQQQQESSSNLEQHYNAADTPNLDIRPNTQRPYNYHAHNVKARTRGRSVYARRGATTKQEGKGLQKKREFVRDKLGAEIDGTVKFKTFQVVED